MQGSLKIRPVRTGSPSQALRSGWLSSRCHQSVCSGSCNVDSIRKRRFIKISLIFAGATRNTINYCHLFLKHLNSLTGRSYVASTQSCPVLSCSVLSCPVLSSPVQCLPASPVTASLSLPVRSSPQPSTAALVPHCSPPSSTHYRLSSPSQLPALMPCPTPAPALL